jgi:hypothetical protein
MRHFLLLSLSLLTGIAVAQRPPLPGIPLVPPPVNHPGLINQPLFQPPARSPAAPRAPARGTKPAAAPEPDPVDPDTVGPKAAGKDLEREVAKVLALPWHTDLSVAKAASLATGKPILWIQALGDLNGYACSALQSLRGTTLANDVLQDQLREHFILGWSDIERAPHVGLSAGYRQDQTAVGTTNGAGGRNVQIVVMANDETVLLVLPGFWHTIDLLQELGLARNLFELHRSTAHTEEQKAKLFAGLHRAFLRNVASGTQGRSRWQAADRFTENLRSALGVRDTFALDAKGQPARDASGIVVLKPLVQVIHERLLAQPFVKWGDFDMEALVDYGQPLHDENAAIEGGRPFAGAIAANEKRERDRAKAASKPKEKKG